MSHTQSQTQQPISSTAPLTGSCFCHTITYTLTAPPIRTYICHCLDCRRFTGSSFAYNGIFAAEALIIRAGKDGDGRVEDAVTTFGGERKGEGTRRFCKRCGSGLFMTVGEAEIEGKGDVEKSEGEGKGGEEEEKIVIIAMGTVNGSERDGRLKPVAEGWCKRRESWMRKAEGTSESGEW